MTISDGDLEQAWNEFLEEPTTRGTARRRAVLAGLGPERRPKRTSRNEQA